MQVILTEEVRGVGRAGEIVNVKDGYGRNYLIPKKLAMVATTSNLRALEHEKKVVADRQNKLKREAEKVGKEIDALSCLIPCQVGEEGKLFGSVTSIDIERFLKEKGIAVERRNILLEEPIKSLGEYNVAIKLHQDVKASLKVSVVKAE
jgi:large subunit ribosomal protein L9